MDSNIMDLSSYSKVCNALYKEINDTLQSSVQKAIMLGEKLCIARDQMGFGKFVAWIEARCDFSKPTAYFYIRMAEYKSQIESFSTIEEARRLIASDRNKLKKTKEAENDKQTKDLLNKKAFSDFATAVCGPSEPAVDDNKLREAAYSSIDRYITSLPDDRKIEAVAGLIGYLTEIKVDLETKDFTLNGN